jgi:hypothetical protein
MILTKFLKVVLGSHPGSAFAFAGLTISISTSVGLKYLGSIVTTSLPDDFKIPFSSSPEPRQIISSPSTLKVSSTNSRIE